MSNVIHVQFKKHIDDPVAQKLVEIANEIDAVILKHLNDKDVEARDLVGLLSHRLGSLMNHMDQKSELWGVCEKVMKQQAHID